jgi:hypothetical protein
MMEREDEVDHRRTRTIAFLAFGVFTPSLFAGLIDVSIASTGSGACQSSFLGVPTGADASVTGSLAVSVDAAAYYNFGVPNDSGSCFVNVALAVRLDGPLRPGFLELQLNGDSDGDGPIPGGAGLSVDGVFAIGCPFCIGPRVVPIQFGYNYAIHAMAIGSYQGTLYGRFGFVQASLMAYDFVPGPGPGGVVKQYEPLFLTSPESGTLMLTLAGVGLMIGKATDRNRNRPRR